MRRKGSAVTAPQPSPPVIACVTWARVFPALPAQAGHARRFLAGILGDQPGAGDALLCLSELAANAIRHSRSARPGGQFTVRVSRLPGRLRVEVTDEGGPWSPRPAGDGCGRGLVIVRALAGEVQISQAGPDGPRTVAFELGPG